MKARPRLQYMPDLVKRRITDNLDFYVDKMSLRTACPNFRPIIGDPEAQCCILGVRGLSAGVMISLKTDDHLEQTRTYEKTDKGCKVLIRHERLWTFGKLEIDEQKARNREIVVENEEFMELVKEDFEMIVNNPNLSINTLSLEKHSDVNLADLLKYKLKVKEFQARRFEAKDHAELHQILPYLDSDFLETFRMYSELESLDPEILQQWKNLKKLVLFHNCNLSMNVWWNIPKTVMTLNHLKPDDLTTILEHFQSTSEAPRFERSQICTKFREQEIKAVLERSGAQFHESRGYQCAQLISDGENKRSLYLYVKHRTVQFAKEPIGYRESHEDDYDDDFNDYYM